MFQLPKSAFLRKVTTFGNWAESEPFDGELDCSDFVGAAERTAWLVPIEPTERRFGCNKVIEPAESRLSEQRGIESTERRFSFDNSETIESSDE